VRAQVWLGWLTVRENIDFGPRSRGRLHSHHAREAA
jgi:hypothetical protein